MGDSTEQLGSSTMGDSTEHVHHGRTARHGCEPASDTGDVSEASSDSAAKAVGISTSGGAPGQSKDVGPAQPTAPRTPTAATTPTAPTAVAQSTAPTAPPPPKLDRMDFEKLFPVDSAATQLTSMMRGFESVGCVDAKV